MSVVKGATTIGARGLIITGFDNAGTFGLSGDILNSGTGIKINNMGYITHFKSGNHSDINTSGEYTLINVTAFV